MIAKIKTIRVYINGEYFKTLKTSDFDGIKARCVSRKSGIVIYYKVIDFVSNVDLFLALKTQGVPNYAIVELVWDNDFFYQASITYMNF